jgi:hypothetical protein
MIAAYVTFFDGYVTKKSDDNCRHLFMWFCCEKGDDSNVGTFFYGGGLVKKVMAASFHHLLFFFFFFSGAFGLIHEN